MRQHSDQPTATRSSNYLERYLHMKASADIQQLEVFPNCKEITESFAMLLAADKAGFVFKRDDVLALCVGDGTTPRTGTLVAFHSGWTAISVDPKMGKDIRWHGVKRLYHYPVKVEDLINAVTFERDWIGRHVVVMACHSHASLRSSVISALDLDPKTVTVISMSCCEPDDLPIMPDIEYDDKYVWSPKNHVRIWKPRERGFWETITTLNFRPVKL